MFKNFNSAPDSLFFSKNDPSDLRLGDRVQRETEVQAQKNNLCLWGYPDDEGIQINGGRLGAAKGPDCIRKYLYKMTMPCSLSDIEKEPLIFDKGNLNCKSSLNLRASSIEQRHEYAKEQTFKSLQQNQRFISLGGGHDYGYPDSAGFLDHCKASKFENPLVINFDAHLDVRSTEKGLSSGTSFFRLIENYKNFNLAQIGIQSQCNSKNHFEWCLQKEVQIIMSEDVSLKNMKEKLGPWIKNNRPCFISVDIDVFSSSHAMGCSQSWPIGLDPKIFFLCFDFLISKLNVLGLGIYETSPPLDIQDQTSKLAALIAHRFIYNG